MNCGACGQDRHPVIEGDQSGRFVYTCGNGECHAFIRLHERSEPTVSVQVPKADTHVHTDAVSTPAPRAPGAAPQNVDAAVAMLAARLTEVDAVLETVPSLKAEQKRLRRMLEAAAPKHAHGAKAHQ